MENLDHITKLSQLYRLAIKDQRALMERADVVSASSYFLQKENDGKDTHCTACLAGAVMCGSLNQLEKLDEQEQKIRDDPYNDDVYQIGITPVQLPSFRDYELLSMVDSTRNCHFDVVFSQAKIMGLLPGCSHISTDKFTRGLRELFTDCLGPLPYRWQTDDDTNLHLLIERLERLCDELEDMGL